MAIFFAFFCKFLKQKWAESGQTKTKVARSPFFQIKSGQKICEFFPKNPPTFLFYISNAGKNINSIATKNVISLTITVKPIANKNNKIAKIMLRHPWFSFLIFSPFDIMHQTLVILVIALSSIFSKISMTLSRYHRHFFKSVIIVPLNLQRLIYLMQLPRQ